MQENIRWKSAHEWGGGLSCRKGHHLLYSEGSMGLPSDKNHSDASGGLPRGKIILRSLGDFPGGNSFQEVSGSS